jgi:hypothetical protein
MRDGRIGRVGMDRKGRQVGGYMAHTRIRDVKNTGICGSFQGVTVYNNIQSIPVSGTHPPLPPIYYIMG